MIANSPHAPPMNNNETKPLCQLSLVNGPLNYEAMTASRRAWLDEVLRPWCLQAPVSQLKRAELEWHDLAGRVDPLRTLWLWAWSRFPVLVVDGLSGLEEAYLVMVCLKNGTKATGYPDSRRSLRGQLVILGNDATAQEASFSLDEILSIERIEAAPGSPSDW